MAVVVHSDDERTPAPDPGRGRDDQLLAVAPERCAGAVDRDGADVQAAQVEIEVDRMPCPIATLDYATRIAAEELGVGVNDPTLRVRYQVTRRESK